MSLEEAVAVLVGKVILQRDSMGNVHRHPIIGVVDCNYGVKEVHTGIGVREEWHIPDCLLHAMLLAEPGDDMPLALCNGDAI